MIEFNIAEIFKDEFILSYTNRMLRKVKTFNLDTPAGNYNISREDLEFIFFNPFDVGNCKNEFIIDYYHIMIFLSYGKKYFDFLKMEWNEQGKTRREIIEKSRTERENIIKKVTAERLNKYICFCLENVIRTQENYYELHKNIFKLIHSINKNIEKNIHYGLIENCVRNSIIKEIGIKVCPYCNVQYIGSYFHHQNQKNTASLDHFYPKSKFPLYSVSLVNLVPSCAYCNGMIKKDRLYPIKRIYVDDAEYSRYFKLKYKNIDGLLGLSDNIELTISNHKKMGITNHFFRHKDMYSMYLTDIRKWLKKKRLHNKSYQNHLKNILKENITEDELKMMLFENCGSLNDVRNKPFGKIKQDVLKL